MYCLSNKTHPDEFSAILEEVITKLQKAELNKNELSNMQLCQFEQSLRSLPDAKAEFRICRDSTGAALEVSRKADGSVKWPVCDGGGDTLIQVAWQAQPEKEGDSTNGPLYTFQSRVTD